MRYRIRAARINLMLEKLNLAVCGGACLKSQHSGGKCRRITVSSKVSLIYKVNYRTARTITQRNPVLKNKKGRKKEKKS